MTQPGPHPRGRVRFGEFELDVRSGELWTIPTGENSEKIVLREQPFLILQMLIEREGEVATREEIKSALWPDERTVDFNHSINVAIASLRQVLGDSASDPHYIETVARRGYRLIPSPEWVLISESRADVISENGIEEIAQEAVLTSAPPPAVPRQPMSGQKRLGGRAWRWLGVATLSLVVAIGGISLWRSRHTLQLSANDTVVLADINNQTSDPIFDDALNTALRVEFEQTPFLHILAPDKVRGAIESLHRPTDAKLTPESAREVCLHTNSRAVIAGSIADAGNRFQIELRGIDCQTGKTVARAKDVVASRNEIVHAVGTAGEELRSKMGEPKASVAKFSKPLEIATSSSLEALQLLTEGYRHHLARDPSAASYYQRAIALDPKLALAYTALGALDSNLGQMNEASEAEKKAYESRDRLTGPTRFLAETLYYDLVTGELEKSNMVYAEWVRTFPFDVRAHINFSFCLINLGLYERAVAEAREAVRLLPSASTYGNLEQFTILEGYPQEAKAVFDEAEAKGFDSAGLRHQRHCVGFLQRDKAAMQEQVAWATGKSGIAALVLLGESNAQAADGHFQNAARWLERGKETLAKADLTDFTTDYTQGFAMQEAEVGKMAEAQRLTASVASAARAQHQRLDQAMLFARTGDIQKAQTLAAKLNQEFPLDTMAQTYALPLIHAAIHLQQNDPAAAIESLRPAAKYELGDPDSFNSIYPAYLRGLAYLQMGNGSSAAPEFQKLLDHPGVVGRYVTGALARLQLGRAQAMAGDHAAARQSYQDFLNLWKDADPDIPIYKQAKAEYAKLN